MSPFTNCDLVHCICMCCFPCLVNEQLIGTWHCNQNSPFHLTVLFGARTLEKVQSVYALLSRAMEEPSYIYIFSFWLQYSFGLNPQMRMQTRFVSILISRSELIKWTGRPLYVSHTNLLISSQHTLFFLDTVYDNLIMVVGGTDNRSLVVLITSDVHEYLFGTII